MSEQYPYQQANPAAAIGGGNLNLNGQKEAAYKRALGAQAQNAASACETAREADEVIIQIACTLQRIEVQRNRLSSISYRISGPYPVDPQKDQVRDTPSNLCGKLRLLLTACESIEMGMMPALDQIDRII